ncbi:MAG: iron-sulfur cluster carrier protein ApbC [Brachymonas sp.]|uniref:iron-sulfur cluster carrier protein ApbC n=1 Tax=unclassified Brachymonas TaxID=2621329 RepID=UPI0035ADDC26
MSIPAPLLQALAGVRDECGQSLVNERTIRDLVWTQGRLSFTLVMGYPAASQHARIRAELEAAARTLPDVREVAVDIRTEVVPHVVQSGIQLIKGVRNVVAVASGKGGVGKSTTAANLALALAAEGARVGVLDADIYGPSMPMMLGVQGRPESLDGKLMEPLVAHGLRVMSIGFLIEGDQAMIWRGPMASQALDQLLHQTHWGTAPDDELDYLVVDMPPGTGDIQLSLSQRVPVTGAVMVTTPQDIALLDVKKGINMFQKVGVPILGIVENMAVHICSQCGHAEHIFGQEGGKRLAQAQGLEYLGALPLSLQIREQADGGQPTVVAAPASAEAGIYRDIARRVAAEIAGSGRDYTHKFPTIKVSQQT